MSEAYLMAMPVIIYNLGGEMIYVLCSRLKAQEIPNDKSNKVIHDVVSHLFDRKFLSEINKHRIVSKHQEVRQMFEKLAHSSIMRLNTTSMSKLFELILMSLKLQVLRVRYPEEIYKITINHLESIKKILGEQDPKNNNELINQLNECIKNFMCNYSKLSPYDYIILKQTLMRFLQGKNVKVSIFIQDNLQGNNSTIFLPMTEKAPPFVNKPGIIKETDGKGQVIKEDFIELKLSNLFIANNNKNRMCNFETSLGMNIFTNENKPTISGKKVQNNNEEAPAPAPAPAPAKDVTNEFKRETTNKKIQESSIFSSKEVMENQKEPIKQSTVQVTSMTEEQKTMISKSVIKDFKDLSDLLVIPKSNDNGTFKLDLFGSSKKEGNNGNNDDYIEIEREDNLKSKFDNCFDINDKQNIDNNENDDDLLDLMDKATDLH